jgi:glycosyltransferase involved in cell wall biosynthesis
MASGLPVLAFDHAAAGQLIRRGENGWLVPPDDEARFVAAAVALSGDPALRRALGPRARVTALAQGWDGVIARFEGHLAAACEAGAAWRTAGGLPPPRRAAILQDGQRAGP